MYAQYMRKTDDSDQYPCNRKLCTVNCCIDTDNTSLDAAKTFVK